MTVPETKLNTADQMQRPEPAFEAPWHAQAFALAVHLNESGRFTWPEWVERFSAALKEAGLSRELNGGDDYFTVWLATLERLMSDRGHTDPAEVARVREDWAEAYLSTPHGAPVHLPEGRG
jgi:nitrile hydratase accessory protein